MTDVALLSLRSALRSYSSTYAAFRRAFHVLGASGPGARDEMLRRHNTDYIEACFSAVVHFQHFAEIVCKQILFQSHPLLAVSKLDMKHELLHRLLQREDISAEEAERLDWSEFSTALERVVALVGNKRLSPDSYGFIVEAAPALRVVNSLRNRLLHRGRFFIFYDALDDLVGGHLLPFALSATLLPMYREQEHLWRPRPLKCGVDPIECLASSFGGGRFELERVAFFKELTRAGFQNELSTGGFLYEEGEKLRTAAEAAAAANSDGVYEVRECPVCGVRSLVVFEDSDTEIDDQGRSLGHWWKTFMIRCECCGLLMDDDLANPRHYGVDVPDFWELKTW